MKNPIRRLSLIAALVCVAIGGSRPLPAATTPEDEKSGMEERMGRLERIVRDLAQTQEGQMHRMNQGPDRMPGMRPPGPENMGNPGPPPMAPHPLLQQAFKHVGDMCRLIFLCCLICNILMAAWIFTDIRQRGDGPGIFVALALVAGIPAALIYSLVRLADKLGEKKA